MTTTQADERRDVNYSSLDDLRADVEHLAAGPVRTVGNWSFGQILTHLARTMEFSLDGFPFQASWPVRTICGLFFKRRFLHKKMPSGFKLPAKATVMYPESVSDDEGLARMRSVLDRLLQEEPTAEHPFMGRLTPGEWALLHMRHAELHLSFARPAEGAG